MGVAAIYLNYREASYVDEYGNQFRYWARVVGTDGSDIGKIAYDVILTTPGLGESDQAGPAITCQ
jgi:hypothetical protein